MRTTVVAATTALALAGAVLVAPAADAAGRGVTKIHTTKKHTVSIGHTLRPGVVHLRNTGSGAVLVVRKKKAGIPSLVKALGAKSQSAERRAMAKFDFVEIAVPKTDSWVRLARGTYYVVDLGVEKIKSSRVGTVVVKGRTANARVPKARSIVFSKKNTLPASTTVRHRSPVRVVNHSTYLAQAVFFPIKSSLSAADVKDLVANPTSAKFDESLTLSSFGLVPVVVGPRHTATATTKFKAGRYLLINGSAFDHKLRRGDVGLLTVR